MASRDYLSAYTEFDNAINTYGSNISHFDNTINLDVPSGFALALKAVTSDLLGRTRNSEEMWEMAEEETGWSKDRLLKMVEKIMLVFRWPPDRIGETMCDLKVYRLSCP